MNKFNDDFYLPPKTIALLGGVNSFDNDYEKYAEALFSDIEDKEERQRKILNFLMENKDYYKLLEYRLRNNSNLQGVIISREINDFIGKISYEIFKIF